MPELPEVETVVRTLSPRISGRRVERVTVFRADIVEPAGTDFARLIDGRIISKIGRRGKKIVFSLDNGNRFVIHLGMTGRLTIESAQSDRAGHTHLLVGFGGEEMRFSDPRRFGGVFWLGTTESEEEGLGPEPLTVRPGELAERLSKTKRAIKTALLDQSLIAGIGNIYADEALFTSGIHPKIRADKLNASQVAALTRAIKLVLRRALRHRGSTLRDYRDANGESGDFQKLHQVYDRKGKPCVVCGTAIARIVLGGRSSHFCPSCQARAKKR
jgi:formamidopyrimidine-DNA glycosylase